jgi:hypothetical protein
LLYFAKVIKNLKLASMKNLLFVLFFLNISTFAYSQKAEESETLKTVISFSETMYDFGNIFETDGKVSHTFEVTNTGKSDLLITNVQGSCGCAVSEWSKTPILPNKKGFIKVTYNPQNRPGVFNKTISVSNNSSENTVVLIIKGNVVRKEVK